MWGRLCRPTMMLKIRFEIAAGETGPVSLLVRTRSIERADAS
nr:hypothetical protein [uncultured bacterium]